MKTQMRFGVLALAAAAMLFSACEKGDVKSTDNIIDESRTATITVICGANVSTDPTTTAPTGSLNMLDAVPAGAKMVVSCSNADLGGGTGSYSQNVELTGNSVEITVPVLPQGTAYSLAVNDVVAKHTYKKTTTTGEEEVTEDFLYTANLSNSTLTLKPGQKEIVTVRYNAQERATSTAVLRIQMGAQLDRTAYIDAKEQLHKEYKKLEESASEKHKSISEKSDLRDAESDPEKKAALQKEINALIEERDEIKDKMDKIYNTAVEVPLQALPEGILLTLTTYIDGQNYVQKQVLTGNAVDIVVPTGSSTKYSISLNSVDANYTYYVDEDGDEIDDIDIVWELQERLDNKVKKTEKRTFSPAAPGSVTMTPGSIERITIKYEVGSSTQGPIWE